MLLNSALLSRGAKKPRNYRGSLPYVNLETLDPAVLTKSLSNINNLDIGPPRHRLYMLFNSTFIPFISNNFGFYNECDGALMHLILGPFATRKPAFWCQKNEDQNDHT